MGHPSSKDPSSSLVSSTVDHGDLKKTKVKRETDLVSHHKSCIQDAYDEGELPLFVNKTHIGLFCALIN